MLSLLLLHMSVLCIIERASYMKSEMSTPPEFLRRALFVPGTGTCLSIENGKNNRWKKGLVEPS